MNEKNLEAVLDMFSRYGIKWVSMQHIARELGISKKTLYEMFTNKDELVASAVELSLKQMWRAIEQAKEESTSSVQMVLQTSLVVYRRSTAFCPAFYEDLRLFHEASGKLANARKRLIEIYARYFAEGVRQELFIPGENYGTIGTIYADLLGNYRPEFQSTLILTLLRGVCTEKGVHELRKYRNLTNNIIHTLQYTYNNG